jgi:hypothetical protein
MSEQGFWVLPFVWLELPSLACSQDTDHSVPASQPSSSQESGILTKHPDQTSGASRLHPPRNTLSPRHLTSQTPSSYITWSDLP